MPHGLPLLPTTVVGSYAHPSWFYAAKELMEAGRFGPVDVKETFDDAVDRAILDQEEAGLDVISDGEMRRASFVWAFASRMTGLRDGGAPRKMGPMSLDMRNVQETIGPGCKWIQLDEPATPGYAANDPHSPSDIARLFNACIEGVTGMHFSLHFSLHTCFGSFRKLPYAKKTYARYFPDLLESKCDQFVLEYGTREMSEIEQWMNWAPDRELGAGIIDIRTHYCETPDDVAERVRKCLDYVPADKLFLTTDCGMRYVHRTLARQKITNLVAGVRQVRETL